MEKKKVVHEESMPIQQALEYLQAVIDDLQHGEFVLAGSEYSLSFKPADVVELEVELEHKNGKEELEIDLSWKPEGYVEEEIEEGEEEGEEGEAKAETTPQDAVESSAGLWRSVSKVLPLVSLAIMAGLAAYHFRGKKKRGKVERVLEASREEAKKLVEQGSQLIEESEKIVERGIVEAEKRLKKVKKSPEFKKIASSL